MPFVTLDGRTVAYRLLGGDTQPLLLLAHPLGMSQAVWDSVVTPLTRRFRVLTWDLPGHGASAGWDRARGEITPAALAAEALALADLAGAERFHFAGTSIGGVIGQQLLSAHPERLYSATLTNTGAVIGSAEMWQTRAERVRSEGLAAMSAEIVPRWFAPASVEADPALAAGWRLAMARNEAESYALLCEMLGRHTFVGRLGANAGAATQAVPLTLIGGSEDGATPPATLAALADECGAEAPTIFDGVGHVPSLEAPARLVELLLARLSPAASREQGVDLATGMETRRAVLGADHVARATQQASSLDRPFQQMITRLAWGELWSDPDLDHRERSMITTAILAALGREELTLHLKTARRIGLSEAELRQVLMHVAVYAGVPAANHAFALAKQHGWGG
ncbi:alpha/beta fold hydrolase [Salinicola sp. JS01]|uniref:alpha/beta fold hydrolase n=1 Tax=Salinicola sp. JS01 TaxID=3050071 RepID=UPI00255C09DE|nr:alpha/beta fold hydrolase [Salinicola sp. JS01]WIX33430.1 alpha/beta fold hydrolase [Salinicola sp. JS01]